MSYKVQKLIILIKFMIKITIVILDRSSQVSHSNKNSTEQQKNKISLHVILICRSNPNQKKGEILLMKFHQLNRLNLIISYRSLWLKGKYKFLNHLQIYLSQLQVHF